METRSRGNVPDQIGLGGECRVGRRINSSKPRQPGRVRPSTRPRPLHMITDFVDYVA
jgi:hypothetical protein